MCGITGYFHLDGPGRRRDDDLAAMAEAIFHRGPDENGTWVDDNVGLAIRRLSIIDLETGSQPITNEDETAVGTVSLSLGHATDQLAAVFTQIFQRLKRIGPEEKGLAYARL